MARMQVTFSRIAVGCLFAVMVTGCQWTGLAQGPPVSHAPTQEPAAPAQTASAPPASPAPAAPSTDRAQSPQAAAVEREVQEFVNRFPDSDLSRKVAASAGEGDAAGGRPAIMAGQRPVSEMPGGMVKSSAAAGATDATAPDGSIVRNSAPLPPETTLRQASGMPPAAPAVTPTNAGIDSPGTPSGQSAVIRANSPLSSDRVARSGSLNGANAAPPAPKVEAIEIAPISAPTPAEPTPPKAEPNRAATAQPAPKVRDLDGTIAQLQKAVAERPNDFAAMFRLRMFYLADGLDDQATAPVAGLEPETGELFADLTRTLVAVRDAARDPLNRSTPAIDQTRQLAQRLRRQAPVSIDKVALVSRVNSYGDYDEVAPAEFPAGQGTHLILYAEVSNFRSEKADGDRYRTLLGETVEVFDAKGQSVFKQVHDKIPDTCRRVRNDFFLALELALPEALAPGTYTVKATVEDKLSATADQGQVTFTIAAPKR